MARRVVWSDPVTGRFLSAADAAETEALRTVYDGGAVVEQGLYRYGVEAESTVTDDVENWAMTVSKWGATWQTDDAFMNMGALGASQFPAGFDSYRVRFTVAGNPDYPAGFASSDWQTAGEWPPDLSLGEGIGVTGIAMIHFRKT